MEGILFKIAAFSIVLNIASGLFLFIGSGAFSGNGLNYKSDYTSDAVTQLNGEIASSPVESLTNFGEKILDFFTLGLYTKAKLLLNNTIYGFTTALNNVGWLDSGLKAIIDSLLSVVYVVGIYELFTGKKILG